LNLEFLLGQGQSNVLVLTKPYDLDALQKTLAQVTESAHA
jgi:hypothetical protein